MPTSYAIALGSNSRGRHGAPAAELRAAVAALATLGQVRAVAPTIATAPLRSEEHTQNRTYHFLAAGSSLRLE